MLSPTVRRFAVRLALFFIPVAAGVTALVGSAAYLGELEDPRAAALRLAAGDEPELYGPADPGHFFAYKLATIEARRPRFMVFGSSRVLPYRSELLTSAPEAFYNAGSTSWELEEFAALVQRLTAATAPATALVGVDQFWFNHDNRRDLSPSYDPFAAEPYSLDFDRLSASSRAVLVELFRPEGIRNNAVWWLMTRREPTFERRATGVIAMARGIGYRNDGNIQRGPASADSQLAAREIARNLQESLSGTGGIYGAGTDLAEGQLTLLADTLDRLKTLGVDVVGFAPPYAPTIWASMTRSGRHQYLERYRTRVPAIFAALGYAFVDISDPVSVGGAETEMYDGSHAAELLMLRSYVHLLRAAPEALGRYSDAAVLAARIAAAASPFHVFDRPRTESND